MATPKKLILDLINNLPEEKIGKVISFIKFIQEEDDPVLFLESDEEKEIIHILEENQWYSSNDVKDMIEDIQNE